MDSRASAPITMCLSKVTLTEGTTTTLSNTGTIVYSIRGKAYSKAAMTNAATPTTDWATGAAFIGVKANKGSVFMVGLDASGNLKAIQGDIVDLDASGAFVVAPNFGGMGPSGSAASSNNFCPIGYIVIKAGSTADATTGWIFGTSNMDGVTGVTSTCIDLCGIPDRPQIA